MAVLLKYSAIRAGYSRNPWAVTAAIPASSSISVAITEQRTAPAAIHTASAGNGTSGFDKVQLRSSATCLLAGRVQQQAGLVLHRTSRC